MLDIEKINASNIKIDAVNKRLDALRKMLIDKSRFNEIIPNLLGFDISSDTSIVTVFQNDDITITYGEWKNSNSVYPSHCHSESLEYIICITGKLLIKFGDNEQESIIISKGECFKIPIGMRHSCKSLDMNTSVIAICVPPEEAYMKL